MSGFLRCIQEEKSPSNRDIMLDYLGNLMEDDSTYAILLTNMEADKVTWSETKKMTGYIGHMHRHISHNQSSATHTFTKKVLTPEMVLIVGSFRNENCKYPSHHKTAGTFTDIFVKVVMEQKNVVRRIEQKTK